MSDGDIAKLRAVLEELDDDPTAEELVANDLEFHPGCEGLCDCPPVPIC